MIKKIKIICFIFLFLFLISAVSAVDNENKTLKENLNDTSKLKAINLENNTQNLCSINGEIGQINTNSKLTKEKVNIKASNINIYYKDSVDRKSVV